jgi:hypothetical protein
MDKTTAGLLGAVTGLATMGAAHAATAPAVDPTAALHASSYAELLAPVQNAVAVMKADDARQARESVPNAPVPNNDVQPVQYYYNGGPPAYYHHHHHYHHAYYHHHHYHHHHGTYVGVPGVGGVVVR